MTNFQRSTLVIGLFALAGVVAAWWPTGIGGGNPVRVPTPAPADEPAQASPAKLAKVDLPEAEPFFVAAPQSLSRDPLPVTALRPAVGDEPMVEPFFTPLLSAKTQDAFRSPEIIPPQQLAASPTAAENMAAKFEAIERERRERFATLDHRWQTFEKSWQEWQKQHAAAELVTQWELDKLQARVRQLESAEKPIVEPIPAPRTVELPAPVQEPTVPMARLQLSNEYGEEATININGTPYRLAPGNTRTVTIPAGAYSFQVLPWQKTPQERTIAAGEERPIRLQKPKQ